MITAALAAIAGGFGALARYGLDTALARRLSDGWHRLLVINIGGSALLGVLAGLASAQVVHPEIQLIVGAGFLGGYTTFSAASLATVELAEERRWPATLLSSLGMLVSSSAAAALGLVLGSALQT